MYGLIGKSLKHSYSKLIHESLEIKQYQLIELDEIESLDNLSSLKGFNVTHPFKNKILTYLDHLDSVSKETQSINTVIHQSNMYYGYNTDYYGFEMTIKKHEINLFNKKVLILGNGSVSDTVYFYLKNHGVDKITRLARKIKKPYDDFLNRAYLYTDYEIIINTTPVGIYPTIDDECLISFEDFDLCQVFIDLNYNPIRTKHIIAAQNKKIKTVNGLYMLIMQAKKSQELFLNKNLNHLSIRPIYEKLIREKLNIILIGMPLSGKTKMGKLISDFYRKEWIDTDDFIQNSYQKTVNEFFEIEGEKGFRLAEAKLAKQLSNRQNLVISTGGGFILSPENIDYLKHHGIIIYVNHEIDKMDQKDKQNRPLLKHMDDYHALLKSRKRLYQGACDIEITRETSMKEIEDKIYEYLSH